MTTQFSLRRLEQSLLWIFALFVFINQTVLIIVQNRPIEAYWQVIAWAICTFTLHLVLNDRVTQRDPLLFPIMMLLIGWGLTAIDRLAPTFADRQAFWLIISSVFMIIMLHLNTNLQWLAAYPYQWLGFGLLNLFATLIIGVNPTGFGPRLWLGIGNIFFQPSEILKLILLVFIAHYFSRHSAELREHHFHWRLLFPTTIIVLICLTVLVVQRDLGTAGIYFAVYALLIYLVTGRWIVLLGGCSLAILGASVAYFTYDIAALRVDVWVNPWPQADNQSFQIVQSLMAISSGGLVGTGVGQGLPTFIPVVHSDFVFAAIAEEWGLLGIIALIGSYFILTLRGFSIAASYTVLSFPSILAAGISVMLAFQSILIIGGTTRLLPLTGVTLPLVSYGGSSLLTTVLAIGILIILSHNHASQPTTA